LARLAPFPLLARSRGVNVDCFIICDGKRYLTMCQELLTVTLLRHTFIMLYDPSA
jgi:hypothetical protein